MGDFVDKCTCGLPKISIESEELQDVIVKAMEEIPPKIQENCDQFPLEIDKCAPKPFQVTDTTIELTTKSTQDEIEIAAIQSAYGTQTRESIKEIVWNEIEPSIDAQLESADVTQTLKNKAKELFRENTVDPTIDKLFAEALDEMRK